jgi:hypothetical protein
MNLIQDIFQTDSSKIDDFFGFRMNEIESLLLERARAHRPDGNHKTWGHYLHQGNQTWVGLDPQVLMTPYSELVHLCQLLKPKKGSHVVDLGAGYGRLALVLKHFCPGVRFTGYEYVLERVEEGSRVLNLHQCFEARLLVQDLTSPNFQIPEADYYFLYDYGELLHIRKTLEQLADMDSRRHFKLIARGKGSRGLVQYEHPWLSQVFEPHHEENFSIYSTFQEDSSFPI